MPAAQGLHGRPIFAREAGPDIAGTDPVQVPGVGGIHTSLGRNLTLPDVLGSAPALRPTTLTPGVAGVCPTLTGVGPAVTNTTASSPAKAPADPKAATDKAAEDAKDTVDAKAKDLGIKLP